MQYKEARTRCEFLQTEYFSWYHNLDQLILPVWYKICLYNNSLCYEENTTNFHFIGQDSTGQASVFKVLSFCETPSIATVPSSRIYCSGYSEAWVSMLVLILQFLIFAPWWQSSCFKICITIKNIYYHWQCYAIFGIVNVWIHVPLSFGVAWLFTQSQHEQNVKETLITHDKYK